MSDLDTGEVGDGRIDVHMDAAMEMTTVAAPTAVETAGATMFELIERNEYGKRRRRSEILATPSEWRSRMERILQQQVQELTQLHQTVAHLSNLVQGQAAREEVQRLGMTKWRQVTEQNRDDRHSDNNMWGADITAMIAKMMKGVTPRYQARQEEREETVGMDGGGLEVWQHPDPR